MQALGGLPPIPDQQAAQDFVYGMVAYTVSGRGIALSIKLACRGDPETDGLIGFLRLIDLDEHASVAALNYEIGAAYRGQGFASEAVRAVVRLAHSSLGLNRLEANVFEGNLASVRVLERSGFTREGVQREKVLLQQGRRQDRWLYARLARDPL
jgi:RimJ/RimL family protein N-acetyltransferase